MAETRVLVRNICMENLCLWASAKFTLIKCKYSAFFQLLWCMLLSFSWLWYPHLDHFSATQFYCSHMNSLYESLVEYPYERGHFVTAPSYYFSPPDWIAMVPVLFWRGSCVDQNFMKYSNYRTMHTYKYATKK